MSQAVVELLKTINEQLGQPIFDMKVPIAYNQITGNCMLKHFHCLMNFKSIQNKKNHINQMSKILRELTPKSQEQICVTLNSNKNTDITKFLTSILIAQKCKRQTLEKNRKQLVVNIRKNLPLDSHKTNAFYLLYSQIYAVSETQRQIAMHDIFSDPISLKKMLMSLKKMMGDQKYETKTSNKNKDLYSINLDIKSILSLIAQKNSGTKQGKMFEELVQQSQSKKWLGPRLYKLLEEKNWGSQQTIILINSLRSIKLKDLDFRSSPTALKLVIKSILTNLRKYRKTCKKPSPKKEIDEQKIGRPQEQKTLKPDIVMDSQQQEKLLLLTNNQRLQKQNNLQLFEQFRWDTPSFLNFSQESMQQVFPIYEEDINQLNDFL